METEAGPCRRGLPRGYASAAGLIRTGTHRGGLPVRRPPLSHPELRRLAGKRAPAPGSVEAASGYQLEKEPNPSKVLVGGVVTLAHSSPVSCSSATG